MKKIKLSNIILITAIGIVTMLTILFFVLIIAVYCNLENIIKIDEKRFIGKTIEEIENKYGEFDFTQDLDGDGENDVYGYHVIDRLGIDTDYDYYLEVDKEGKIKSCMLEPSNYYGGWLWKNIIVKNK